MTMSSKRRAAALAALSVLAAAAFAENPSAPGAGAARGPERTDPPAVDARPSAPATDPGRATADREAGRDVPGRTFAPQSDPARTPPERPKTGEKAISTPPQSPATGDASGGDRRTQAPWNLGHPWGNDPDFRAALQGVHSVGVADFRRVNDAAGGDWPSPARRVPGASPPPREDRFDLDDRRPQRAGPATTEKTSLRSSPPTSSLSEGRATGERWASAPNSAQNPPRQGE